MSQKKEALRPYHHGELRTALVEAAIATIQREGVGALSLRALAREIGVSHAAPTRHFPTRAHLLAAIAENGIVSLLASATQQLGQKTDGSLTRLQSMTIGYVRWAIVNPAHHLLLRNQDVMRHADEALKEKINQYARLHEETIAHAQKEGWRRDETTRAVFIEITAFTAGLALTASDPIYKTVFGAHPTLAEITGLVVAFFEKRDTE